VAAIPPDLIPKFYNNIPISEISGATYGLPNYKLIYIPSSNSYILNITNHSLFSGYFYSVPGCFKPIYPISSSHDKVKQKYNITFGLSKNIQFGQPSQSPPPTKEHILYDVSHSCMTRQNLSYINSKISPCEHKRRIYIWNKGKPKKPQFES
jgi:hypothetical protein